MLRGLTVLFVVLGLLVSGTAVAQPSIQVDGNPADWSGIAPLIQDPIDGFPLPTAAAWDIVRVSVAYDSSTLFFLFEFTPSSVAALPTDGFVVQFDTDSNASTGCVQNVGDIFGSFASIGSEFLMGINPSGHGLTTLADFRTCSGVPVPGFSPVVAASDGFVEVSFPIASLFTVAPPITAFDIVVAAGSDSTSLGRYVLGSASVCVPPHMITVNALQAEPLSSAVILDSRLNGQHRSVDVRLTNSLSMWLGVDSIVPPGSATPLFGSSLEGEWASVGLIPPCRTGVRGNPFGSPFSCSEPGSASWKVTFCSAGDVQFRVGMTPLAGIATIADLLLPFHIRTLSPSRFVALVEELRGVPGIQRAGQCLVDPTRGDLCGVRELLRIAGDLRQLRQITRILGEYGFNVSVAELIRHFTRLPVRFIPVAGSLVYYGFYLGTNADPTALVIMLEGR
jgi:hypothetical protein